MNSPVEEGDYEGLVSVMAKLLAVREKQNAADAMFEPLMETVELLKYYQQDVSDAVHLQLQVSMAYIIAWKIKKNWTVF